MGFNFKRPQKTFKIGEYYTVPKYIHTKSCNSYDLKKKREESLLESKNPNNIAFEGFIERLRTSTYKKGELDYIKEFPLLIDRSVYQDIARLRLPSELAGCDEIFNKSFSKFFQNFMLFIINNKSISFFLSAVSSYWRYINKACS